MGRIEPLLEGHTTLPWTSLGVDAPPSGHHEPLGWSSDDCSRACQKNGQARVWKDVTFATEISSSGPRLRQSWLCTPLYFCQHICDAGTLAHKRLCLSPSTLYSKKLSTLLFELIIFLAGSVYTVRH
jgi:hypothetical protein